MFATINGKYFIYPKFTDVYYAIELFGAKRGYVAFYVFFSWEGQKVFYIVYLFVLHLQANIDVLNNNALVCVYLLKV
jgi:hypothetical protein